METKIDGTTVLGELMKASWDTIEAFGRCENLRETNLSKVNNEMMVASEKVDASCNKVYVFSDGQKKEISNELVKNNQECLLNVNMIDRDSRNDKNEVEIDFRSIESYWNKIGKDNKKMDELIEDKQSFTNALKEIMCRS